MPQLLIERRLAIALAVLAMLALALFGSGFASINILPPAAYRGDVALAAHFASYDRIQKGCGEFAEYGGGTRWGCVRFEDGEPVL